MSGHSIVGTKFSRRQRPWRVFAARLAMLGMLLQTVALLAPMQPDAVLAALAPAMSLPCHVAKAATPADRTKGATEDSGKPQSGSHPCQICLMLLYFSSACMPIAMATDCPQRAGPVAAADIQPFPGIDLEDRNTGAR